MCPLLMPHLLSSLLSPPFNRYRSEEIQELFLKSQASLKYDRQRRMFVSKMEEKHYVYRAFTTLLTRFQNKKKLFTKSVRWMRSFIDCIKSGRVRPSRTAVKVRQACRFGGRMMLMIVCFTSCIDFTIYRAIVFVGTVYTHWHSPIFIAPSNRPSAHATWYSLFDSTISTSLIRTGSSMA